MRTLDLSPQTVGGLVRWYSEHEVPEPIRAADPAVIATARRLAGGDWTRVVIDDDRSLLVFNSPVWTR